MALNGKGAAVKLLLTVKIAADILQQQPAVVILLQMDAGNKFCIKDPVHQIVFILKMIVKAFAVHAAAFTYVIYIDFAEGLLRHQQFQG